MKTHINIGVSAKRKINIDLDILLRTRLLIQANSGGGKSWLLRRIAEQAFGKIQVIIVDPEGEFATLREKYGYVLVGKGGETPADVRSAALVAHKLLELHASAVCDLYEMKASQRHAWVRAFLDAIVDSPKKLWHPVLVIVDEAHVFAPEKGFGESEAADAMIGLSTRGRKRGFCPIFATQRLGKFRKDAAAECLNVLIGQTFIDVDRKRAAESLGIPKGKDEHSFFDEMKVMDPGNFWALGRAISKERILVRIGEVTTTHPEPGSSKHSIEPPPPPAKIKALLPRLSDLPKEAEQKAKTEADLRAEIASLKRQLTARPTVPVPEAKTIEVPVITDKQLAQLQKAADTVTTALKQLFDSSEKVEKAITVLEAISSEISTTARSKSIIKNELSLLRQGFQAPPAPRPSLPIGGPVKHVSIGYQEPSEGISKGERRVLTAIAQYPEGVTRERITILTGYKRTSRDTYLQKLRQKECVDTTGLTIQATEHGIRVLGTDFQPLPTGIELQEYWRRRLSGGEHKLYEVLMGAHPDWISRAQLGETTGYRKTSVDTYLQKLVARGVAQLGSNSQVKASDTLFD